MINSTKPSILSTPFFLILWVLFQGCNQAEIKYTHFSGESSYLSILESNEVLLLYPRGDYAVDSLALLLETYDKAYAMAVELSGREPLTSPQDTDKLPLAIVSTTCGPGCGRLGHKGIEITKNTFDRIYNEFVVNGRQDHLFFYELGRNFWFYGENSGEADWEAIHTGFAVFFRDLLVNELQLHLAQINGVPYVKYMEDKQNRFERFLAEAQAVDISWEEVKPIKSRYFPHSPFFWSLLWWELYRKKGKEGVISAISRLREQPPPGKEEVWFWFLLESGKPIDTNELY